MNSYNEAYGVIDCVPSVRDYDYEIVCGAVDADNTYPRRYEIEAPSKMRCKNQETVEACVAEVLAQVSEAYFGTEMSEGHIYAAFRTNNTKGPGMIVSDTVGDWKELSTVPLQYFNHLCELPELKDHLKQIPELENLYQQYKISGYAVIKWADRIKKDLCIKDALMNVANKYGLIAVCTGHFGGNHCVWLTGWDDDNDKYLIKNSWGESWGPTKDGRGGVPKSTIREVYVVMFDEFNLPFADVHSDEYWFKAIRNLYCSGVMVGTSSNTFEPDAPLTRGQFAVALDRVLANQDRLNATLSKMTTIKTEIK